MANRNTRGIVIITALLLCIAAALVLFSGDTDTKSVKLYDIGWPALLDYTGAQRDSGIPWYYFYAIDKAEDNDAAGLRTAEQAQKLKAAGILESPYLNDVNAAAQALGLYSQDRSFLKKASRAVLSISRMQAFLSKGSAVAGPAAGYYDDWANSGPAGANYCTVYPGGDVFALFPGTASYDGASLTIECGWGVAAVYTGLSEAAVTQGEVSAGDALGKAEEMQVYISQGGNYVNPYPILMLYAQGD